MKTLKALYKNFIVIVIFSMLLIFYFQEFYLDFPTNDSSIYITYGSLLKDGKYIYKDLFDNKGPTIFLLNYFGSLITYKSSFGVLLIELSMFIAMIFFVYKTFHFPNKIKNTLISFLILSYLFQFYGGNLDTTWFFILSTPVYVFFFKHVENIENLNAFARKFFSFYLGFVFTLVFFLKFNYTTGLLLIFLIYLFKSKKYFLDIIYYFLLGVTLVIFNLYIFLLKNNENFFRDIIHSYFLFNYFYAFPLRFSENFFLNLVHIILANFKGLLLVIFKQPFVLLIIFLLFKSKIIFFRNFYSKKFFILALVLVFDLFSLVLAPVRQASLLFFVPSLFIFQCFIYEQLKNLDYQKYYITIIELFTFIIILFFFNQNIFLNKFNYYRNDIKLLNDLKIHSEIRSEFNALTMCGFTTGTIWFLKTNLVSSSKYYFTPLINSSDYLKNKIYNHYFNILINEQPSYVIINPYCYHENLLKPHFDLLSNFGYVEILINYKNKTKMLDNTRIFYKKKQN
jgi:hypothetical protein